MAKFIFICRGCGKKFKQKANTLQSARKLLALKLGGETLGEDQGFLCGNCSYEKMFKDYNIDRGTIVEDW